MNTLLKDTKVAQHFTVPMFRLIWQVLLGVVAVVGLYFAIINSVAVNAQDIDTNRIKIDIVEVKVDKHIDDTKGEPLTEMQLQNKVENLEDDVQDHDVKITDNHNRALTTETLVGVMREDQKIMKDDIKEILKIIKKE